MKLPFSPFLEKMDTDGLTYTAKLGRYELLGKTYDKLKKYNQAIECFIKAKKTIKTNPLIKNYNPEKYKSEIRLITKSFICKRRLFLSTMTPRSFN